MKKGHKIYLLRGIIENSSSDLNDGFKEEFLKNPDIQIEDIIDDDGYVYEYQLVRKVKIKLNKRIKVTLEEVE